MKNIVLILFCTVFMAAGCKKEEGPIKFKLHNTTAVVIPANSVINVPITIQGPEKQTNINQELENNDSRLDKIRTIRLKKLSLTIKKPSDETFSFLKSVRLYIKANGVDETEIAYLDHIPDDVGGYLEMNVHDKDLSSYVKKETYSLKAAVVTDEVVPQPVDVDVYTEYEVTAGVFGRK